MKLPGIKYSGTPNLAKLPVEAELQKWKSIAGAAEDIGKAVIKIKAGIDATESAKTVAQFQTMMAEVNANVGARKSFSVEELDQLGIEYPEKYGKGKIETVPAYIVAPDVYRTLTQEVYDKALEIADPKTKNAISKIYGRMYESGIKQVMVNTISEAAKQQEMETNQNYQMAVRSGNATAAKIIADTALQTGIWSAEQYDKNMSKMPDQIATGVYLRALDANEDPDTLEVLQGNVTIDPDLSVESKSKLMNAFQVKINRVQKQQEKALKEQQDKLSLDQFIAVSAHINENGPIPWDQIDVFTRGMTREDAKGIMTLNRIASTKGINSDPKVMDDLTLQLTQISIPKEGTTVGDRQKAFLDNLMRAAGIDPATGDQIGPSRISHEDYLSLWQKAKQQTEYVTTNKNIGIVVDNIYTTLVGASKDMLTKVFGSGVEYVSAAEAEYDLYKAANATGPGFDPFKWWDDNKKNYVTRAYEKNRARLTKHRLSKYFIKDKDGMYDIKGTIIKLREMQKKNPKIKDEDILNAEKTMTLQNNLRSSLLENK